MTFYVAMHGEAGHSLLMLPPRECNYCFVALVDDVVFWLD